MAITETSLKSLVGEDKYTVLNASLTKGQSYIAYLWMNRDRFNLTVDKLVDFAVANLLEVDELRDTYNLSFCKKAYRSEAYEQFYRQGFIFLQDGCGELYVVTYHPDSIDNIKAVMAAGYDLPPKVYICREDLWQALYGFFVEPEAIQFHARRAVADESINVASNANLDSEARRIYKDLIKIGLRRDASDVHFVPGSNSCMVLYRIDGRYEPYTAIPLGFLDRVYNLITTDAKMPVSSGDSNSVDGHLQFALDDGTSVPLRIHVFNSVCGKDINVRYLSDRMYTFEELGMSPLTLSQYKAIAKEKHGLIVQTGAVGTGKSTTLYSILNEIHQDWRNIITIEDPVEIHLDHVTQINAEQVGQLKFQAALKGTLRHDPDVVVVGEMRDGPTALEAMKEADAGKLVITSLHTNDCIGTFERLINLGIDPYSVGEVMTYSLGQTLVRKLCPHCKTSVIIDPKDKALEVFHLQNYFGTEPFKAYKACGCAKCRNIGYKGRTAVNEVLRIDSQLRYLIQSRSKRKSYEDYLTKTGFVSIYEDALSKVYSGITSLDEIYELANDSLAFKGAKYIGGGKGGV